MGIAHVPSDRGLFFGLTVAEHFRLDGVAAADLDGAFAHFPALRPLKERKAGLLSGGEQQMLAIARALAGRRSRSAPTARCWRRATWAGRRRSQPTPTPTLSETVGIYVGIYVGFPWVVLCGDSRRPDRFSMPWKHTGKSVSGNRPITSITD
jgi:hypothetical protein